MDPSEVGWDMRAGYVTRWQAVIPGQPAGTVVRYRIAGRCSVGPWNGPELWARDGQGYWFRAPHGQGVTTFGYAVGSPEMPSWMHDAVIYHIFLDRFHPGTDDGVFPRSGRTVRHGGTLDGVRRALPYLADLGVTCLWFSPLAPSESYHRYDGTDYRSVDPALGSVDGLKALVGEAHALGMRIWLDFVPSHASWHHPAFLAAQADRSAPSASWFTFYEWPDRYRSFLDMVPSLPSLNGDDPGARAYLLESAGFWAREVGVDGFRLDHAIGMSMDFWTAFRVATKGVSPEFVNVGEVTDTPDSLRRYRGRLDGILDFPLATALRSTFSSGGWTVAQLDALLSAYDRYMEEGPGRVSFLDNHDMNRFLFLAGDDTARLKMAALCQFTLAPTPVIYYGTEIGLSHPHDIQSEYGDAEARGDMSWDPASWDTDLLDFYRQLIAIRRAHSDAWAARRQTLELDAETGVYVYEVGDVVAAFNTGAAAQTVLVGRPLTLLLGTSANDPAAGQDGLTLPPLSAALLRR
jgi:glycosidase